MLINILILSLLIKFTTNKQQDSIVGYFYTGVLFFALIVENVIGQHYYHRMMIVGYEKFYIIYFWFNEITVDYQKCKN